LLVHAVVKTLKQTNTPHRMKSFDPVMPQVVEALMTAMYKDAVLADARSI
jgi:hypothetical protein